MKSLFDILSLSDSWNIVRKNNQLVCINEKQDSYDITQFQMELIKLLKDNIQQKNKRECFIKNEMNSIFKNENIKFENLKLSTKDDILFGYISLMTELVLGNEEFSIQVENLASKYQVNKFFNEMYASQLTFTQKEIYHDGWEFENLHFKFFNLLENNQIHLTVVDFVLNISCKITFVDHNYDHEQKEIRNNQVFRNRYIVIPLENLNCNNLYINISDCGKIYQNFQELHIMISFRLRLLQIKLEKIYKNEQLNINIKFTDQKCYISRVIFQFQDCRELLQNKTYFSKFLQYQQISEYVINYYLNTIPINELYELDKNCEKIIYFNHINHINNDEYVSMFFYSGFEEYLDQEQEELNFIKSRNSLNSMKFQVFAVSLLISKYLKYSPLHTLLDLYLVD